MNGTRIAVLTILVLLGKVSGESGDQARDRCAIDRVQRCDVESLRGYLRADLDTHRPARELAPRVDTHLLRKGGSGLDTR